ncbi:methylated-DNA--[protein]-cysteine S-methyltransferase [Tepidimonas sp.]|uniref:methylated-DNA--[protein]-cysteine S-methyltransferase n=1 Tax=Tepidimonas sp. TaxID=2002775 RepID=UPI002FE12EAF
MRVAVSPAGLRAVSLGTTEDAWRADLCRRFPRAALADGQRTHRAWADAVAALIEAPGRDFALPLDIRGTAFQQRVWAVLRTIPPGQTLGYGEVARRLGAPRATRAVAQACGANPLAVVIPCHRVIASDGRLTGYRWGLEHKRALLQREGVPPPA